MEKAEYIDRNGFLVGNYQFNIIGKIQYLFDVINNVVHKKTIY